MRCGSGATLRTHGALAARKSAFVVQAASPPTRLFSGSEFLTLSSSFSLSLRLPGPEYLAYLVMGIFFVPHPRCGSAIGLSLPCSSPPRPLSRLPEPGLLSAHLQRIPQRDPPNILGVPAPKEPAAEYRSSAHPCREFRAESRDRSLRRSIRN